MSEAEQKEVKLEIGLPQGGFPRTLYFNRFRVERDSGFCLVQFGLVVASDLVDCYSCVLSNEVLKQNEQTLIDFLNRSGRPAERKPAPWKGVTAGRQTDVADVISMAYRGNLAETALYVFSLRAATPAKKGVPAASTLMAQPVVLLRSSAELQKQLIVALYEE